MVRGSAPARTRSAATASVRGVVDSKREAAGVGQNRRVQVSGHNRVDLKTHFPEILESQLAYREAETSTHDIAAARTLSGGDLY